MVEAAKEKLLVSEMACWPAAVAAASESVAAPEELQARARPRASTSTALASAHPPSCVVDTPRRVSLRVGETCCVNPISEVKMWAEF